MKNENGKKQLSLMMIITFITQFLAIYKSTITAANFGAGTELDAYNFSNNLATFLLTFVATGITTVVIPAYIKKTDSKAVNTFITAIFSTVMLLMAIMYLLRMPLVHLLTNREEQFYGFVNEFFLLTIFIQLLPAFLGVTTAYFQCENKYNVPKIILLISNIVVVAILVILKSFNLNTYLWILLLGAVIQFVFDILIAVKSGFRFKPEFEIKNEEFQKLFKIFIPTVFSSGLYKVQSLIDSLLTSNIGVGQLTILTYSNTIVGMVNNMLINNLCVYAYPKIVKASEEKEQDVLWKYIVYFHGVICLLIVGFFAAGREFIGLLYEHGKFTPQAADAVFVCMCIYIFGQQNNIIRDLIYRFFYGHGDTKNTFKNSFMASVVNIVVSIILVIPMGVYGIVLGTVIAGLFSLISILIRYRKSFEFKFNKKLVCSELVKNEVALVLGAIAVFAIKKVAGIDSYIIGLFLYGAISVVVFFFVLLVTKSVIIKSAIKR